ncbi:BTAD domain-containing putative transcriptional regulator [Streptosporangium sp. NPDC004379]|uniref:AfsR/SARP family transcriptional regulator n=1 Tax=Streptosporangium sp. NPDC004379 TaxID=3366189 RepID=UPI0036A40B37
MLRFQVLGSLRVLAGQKVIPVNAPKQRALLALLLSRSNQVVSADRLIDELWGEEPPVSARQTLQSLVSRLRCSLAEPGALVGRSAGYELRLTDPAAFDMRIFDDAVTSVRAGTGEDLAERVERALGLWRGPAFGDVPATPAISAEVARLEEARLQLRELRADLRLAAGAYEEVVTGHRALLAEQPLRERLWEQLMLALYRGGRRSEALKAYAQISGLLDTEIGVGPGAGLRRLHAHILTGDVPGQEGDPEPEAVREPVPEAVRGPAPEAVREPVAVLPGQLPPDPVCFVGRQERLAAAHEALRLSGSRDRAAMVVVSGMAGIGKTAFALRLAHSLRHGFPDGQLFVDLHAAGAEPLEPEEVLLRFLRSVGVSGQDIPAGAEERAAMYRSVLAGRRMLVVLDNAAAEPQVEPLLPGGHACAVLVTSRRRLSGLVGAHHVELGLLTEEESVELLTSAVELERTTETWRAVRRLAALCGHHPLSLRICATRLSAKPHWTAATLADRLADERNRLAELEYRSTDVRASFNLSYQALPPGTRRLFRLLGLLRVSDFAAWLAAPLLDVPVREAEEHVELLVENQLLQVAGRDRMGALRYRFHDLIHLYSRELAASQIAPGERAAALSRVLGAWLALADQAHEAAYGANFLLNHGEFPRWPLEPAYRDRLLADPWAWWGAERGNLVAVITQAADEGFHEACWDLAVTGTTLFGTYGHLDDWQLTHEAALTATTDGGNRRGAAIVLSHLGALRIYQRRYEDALSCLSEAMAELTELGDGRAQALCRIGMGIAERGRGDLPTTLRHFRAACDLISGTGDHLAEAHVLLQTGQTQLMLGATAQAAKVLRWALEIAGRVGSGPVEGYVHYWLGMAQLHACDHAAATWSLSASAGLLAPTGDVRAEVSALQGLARGHLMVGERDKARHALRRAAARAREIPHSGRAARTLAEIAAQLSAHGDHGHAAEVARWAVDRRRVVGDGAPEADLPARHAGDSDGHSHRWALPGLAPAPAGADRPQGLPT